MCVCSLGSNRRRRNERRGEKSDSTHHNRIQQLLLIVSMYQCTVWSLYSASTGPRLVTKLMSCGDASKVRVAIELGYDHLMDDQVTTTVNVNFCVFVNYVEFGIFLGKKICCSNIGITRGLCKIFRAFGAPTKNGKIFMHEISTFIVNPVNVAPRFPIILSSHL